MQSQGLALPPEPKVGPSAACVSTKESCVDPSGNDPDTQINNFHGSNDKGKTTKMGNPSLYAAQF